ncbi:MAG: TlpA disulfide reductase family protein [Gammaproteobacteria bacterium]|nr:TlpA disulfide reductase family protein [Gammaproteobacteria bacterium]
MTHRIHGSLLFVLLFFGVAVHGQPAGVDLEGNPADLSRHTGQGKWLLVKFWASDCHVCAQEAPSVTAFHERHREDDAEVPAEVLGIALDGPDNMAAVQAFRERHGARFPSLVMEPEAGWRLFQQLTGQPWLGTPSYLIYGPDGQLLAQQVGAVPMAMVEDFISRKP